MAVTVTFWGVRGSIPCCSSEYTEYGGNTACVQVDLDGQTVIFDAGSGLRPLGEHLKSQKKQDIVLLISHTHWDHICGFPFFYPLFEKTSNLNLYAPFQPDGASTENIFKLLMSSPFFPLPLHALPSVLHFHDFQISDKFELFNGTVKVQTIYLSHPNGSAGYRLSYKGKSVCYISDYEQISDPPSKEMIDFVRDADLMIYDAMYTPEEYTQFSGWGHSSWEKASLLTNAGNVKKTALFHHSPSHTDEIMRDIEKQAQAANPSLFAAKEKMSVSI